MLGLRGLVVKAHGNAKADVIRICIDQCVKFNEQKIGDKILERFSEEKTEG